MSDSTIGWPDARPGPADDVLHGDLLADVLAEELASLAAALVPGFAGVSHATITATQVVRAVCDLDPGVMHARSGNSPAPHEQFVPLLPEDDELGVEGTVWAVRLFVPQVCGSAILVSVAIESDRDGELIVHASVGEGCSTSGAPSVIAVVHSALSTVPEPDRES